MVLRRIVDRIRSSLEIKVVLQTAVDEIATTLNLDRCSFFWYFHDTNRVQIICENQSSKPHAQKGQASSTSPHSYIGYYPLNTFDALSTAIAQGKLVVHHGGAGQFGLNRWFRKRQSPLAASTYKNPLNANSRANVLVPLEVYEGSIGFIACAANQPRRWTTSEIELLQAIAQQLEIALKQAQLYEQTQKQAQRERLVNQIATQIRGSFELETILRGAIAQLLEVLRVDRCLVHLVDDPNQSLTQPTTYKLQTAKQAVQSTSHEKHLYEVCRAPFQPSVDAFDVTGPITQWVIHNRRRVVISDITQDARIGADNSEYQRAEIKSSLVIPVQTKDTLYAILYLNQCTQVRYWSKNDQKLAQAVADQLAIAIQQAHLYAQTQHQALESAAQAQKLAITLQELRLTQAQLIHSEKMSSLGRIVAGIAHEINNPMNFISGNLPYIEAYTQDFITLLKAYQANPAHSHPSLPALAEAMELDFLISDLPRILASMKVGVDRVQAIVQALRNFSRLDEAQCKIVDLHEGIESTLVVLRSYIREDVKISRNYGTLPQVECYPKQLNQAFMNLLLNALDALNHYDRPHKEISIATNLVSDDEHGAAIVQVVIADNGPGISPEIQSKIFDPFFTTKDVGQGTGLGLTVSYQTIVNQHHGRLEVYSQPGLGATFLIEIPLCQPRQPVTPIRLKEPAIAQ